MFISVPENSNLLFTLILGSPTDDGIHYEILLNDVHCQMFKHPLITQLFLEVLTGHVLVQGIPTTLTIYVTHMT